jgi:ketosteroid isomerase-like protein
MRHLIIASVLATVLVSPAPGQGARDSARVASEIRHLEEEWARALIEQDSLRLRRLLAPEFALLTSANPEQPLNRTDWLALLPRYRTHALPITQLTIRVMRDIAIASFITDLRATVAGADRSNVLFITDVWRHGPDGWQVVARYSSTPEPGSQGTRPLRSRPE